MSNKSKRFPPEFRDRAARMVLEEEKNHPSRWSAVMMIAPKLDIHPDTLSKWTRLHERANAPAVSDLPDQEKIRQLERENRELRQGSTLDHGLHPPQQEHSLSRSRSRDRGWNMGM